MVGIPREASVPGCPLSTQTGNSSVHCAHRPIRPIRSHANRYPVRMLCRSTCMWRAFVPTATIPHPPALTPSDAPSTLRPAQPTEGPNHDRT
jgi:hypothetical protein